jgi:hypothetical protein
MPTTNVIVHETWRISRRVERSLARNEWKTGLAQYLARGRVIAAVNVVNPGGNGKT